MDIFFKNKDRHLKLLKISILIYFEVLILSLFKILNYQSLIFISFLQLIVIYLKRYEIDKIYFRYRLNFVNLSILFVYILYGISSLYSSFTIDDVLTSYLPRVNQWIQNKSVFLNLDLYPYYSTLLTYPIGGQIPLFIIKIFALPDYFYLFLSAYITYQILLTFKKFLKLNEKEYKFAKFLLFLSPIILIISTSGLTDLYFSYFLVNSFYYITSFKDFGNNKYLFLSSVFAIFSINLRYHGLFILLIVGLIVLSSYNINIILKFSKYTFVNLLLFLFPNILWQYLNNFFGYLKNNVETQFNSTYKYLQEIDLEILNNFGFFNNLIFNFYNSFSHTFVNYLFVDFPMLFIVKESQNSFILFLKKFNVFLKNQQVTSLGTINFILCLLFIIYYLINLPKNNLFIKYLMRFAYLIFFTGLILLFFENFYLAATLFLVSFILFLFIKNKKYIFNLKETYLNLNVVLFIFLTYFSLISVRNFNDTNLRYLFPIFLFIFPFGLKLVSNFIISNSFKIFIVIFSMISAIQPLFFNNLININTYPNLGFNNKEYQNISRAWNAGCQNLIRDVYLSYNFLVEKNKDFNTVIATGQKFPISIFDKNEIFFTTFKEPWFVTTQFFNNYDSNILIIGEENVNFDQSEIYLIDLKNYENINTLQENYYIINIYRDGNC